MLVEKNYISLGPKMHSFEFSAIHANCSLAKFLLDYVYAVC